MDVNIQKQIDKWLNDDYDSQTKKVIQTLQKKIQKNYIVHFIQNCLLEQAGYGA